MEKIYYLWDKVAKCPKYPAFARSSEDYVRTILRTSPISPSESECRYVELDLDSSDVFKSIDWSCYKLPQSPMEVLQPLNLSAEDMAKVAEKYSKKE